MTSAERGPYAANDGQDVLAGFNVSVQGGGMPFGGILFDRTTIGRHIERLFGYPIQGRRVQLIRLDGGVSVKPIFWGDMFSHPHIGMAADEKVEWTTKFQEEFINDLFYLKVSASSEFRQYVLQLIYNDGFRHQFLQHTEEELKIAPLTDEEKDALRQTADRLQEKVQEFKQGKVIDDGDHFLLFPQTIERIAPRAWIDAAWPFIAHFRSNFGFYLGEALLYSRVTIVGSPTPNPAVTEEEEQFLKQDESRLVERLPATSGDNLRQVLDWGVSHDVRFGLGDKVSRMILAPVPDDEIMAAIRARFEPETFERQAR
jgi:hypothetical protein